MHLSLSCRIAEGFLSKEEATLSLVELADAAAGAGYQSICMRASQVGVHSSPAAIREARSVLDGHGLTVSMVTGDFDIVYNNDRGPNCLRNITPYLDLAEALGAPMLRVCMKLQEDVALAQSAADEAAARGLTLVHQSHADSLFETVDETEQTLRQIDRENFGLIFEAANLEECGQSYGPETIARLAPWIVNVYVQNQRLHPDGAITLQTRCRGPVSLDVLPIEAAGGINFASIVNGLKQIDYNGPITVHQSAPTDGISTPQSAARSAAETLRELAASA